MRFPSSSSLNKFLIKCFNCWKSFPIYCTSFRWLRNIQWSLSNIWKNSIFERLSDLLRVAQQIGAELEALHLLWSFQKRLSLAAIASTWMRVAGLQPTPNQFQLFGASSLPSLHWSPCSNPISLVRNFPLPPPGAGCSGTNNLHGIWVETNWEGMFFQMKELD